MAKRLNKNLVGGLAATLAMLLVIMGFLFINSLPGQDPEEHARAADAMMEDGNYQSAMEMYHRAYVKRGDRPAAPYLIKASQAALQIPERDSIKLALDFLRMAINKDPRSEEAHRSLIDLWLEITDASAELGGNDISNWQALFDATDKAIELLPSLADDPEILYARGISYLNLESNDSTFRDKGLAALRKAHEIDPTNARVAEQLALSFYADAKIKERQRQYSEADAEIKATRQLLSSTIEKAKAAGNTEGVARLTLIAARVDLAEGETESGIEKIKSVANGETDRELGYRFLAELHLGRLTPSVTLDLDKATAALEEGIQVNPEDGELYRMLGMVYQTRRNNDELSQKEKLAWLDKEAELYRAGLDAIQFTDNYRDQKKRFMRIILIQQLCRQDIVRASLVEGEAQREQVLASAESTIDLMTEILPDNAAPVKFLRALVANARGNIILAIKEGEAALKASGNRATVDLYSIMGDLYRQRSALGNAEEMFRKALALQPLNPGLHRGLGVVLLNQGRYTEALKYLKPDEPQQLREALLNDPIATQLRVEVYTKLDQADLAQAEVDRMDGSAPAAELTNIRLMAVNGRCAEALAAAKKLFEKDTRDKIKIDFLVDTFVRCDERAAGYDYFATYVESNSEDPNLQRASLILAEDSPERTAAIADWLKKNFEGVERELALATHYRSNDMPEKELAALKAAEQLEPTNPQVLDTRFTRCLREAEWDQAEVYARKLAEADLDGTGGLMVRGRLYVAQAEHYRTEDDMDSCRETAKTAVELLSQGLDQYPNNSMGWTLVAQSHLFLTNVPQAKQALERAIEINPNNGLASKLRARLAYIEDDQVTFRRYLDKAARVMADDEWVGRMMLVAREQENPADAIAGRERRRQEAPNDVENLVMLARLYKDDEVAKYRDAEAVYREALAAAPDDLSLVNEVAAFFASDVVNLPQEGEQLLKQRLQAEQELERKARVAMALGAFYAEQGQYATADRHYQMAMSFDESPEMIGRTADFYRRSRRFDKALALYDSIISAGSAPDSKVSEAELKTAEKQRIALLLTLQRYDPAKAAIDEFLARYPNDDQGIIFEGAYHLNGGNIDSALAAFDRHLRNDPGNATALWQRGRLYYLQGDFRKASEDLKLSKAERPDGFEYRHRILLADVLLAEALQKNESGADAARELQEVLKNNPEQERVAQKLVDIYTRMRPPQYESAESLIYRYMQENPANYEWPMLLGNFGRLAGDPAKQLEGYRRAAEVSDYSSDAVTSYFRTLRDLRRCDELIDAALTKVPTAKLNRSAPALAALGFCYGQAGDVEKSLNAFSRAQAAAGNNFVAYDAILGDLITTLGQETAQRHMEEAVANDPSNLVARRAMVHLRFRGEDIDGALTECDTIIQQAVRDGDRLFALVAKGMLYDNKEDFTAARDAYEAALKIDGNHPLALNNISYLLSEKLGQPTEALPYAKRAVKVDPNNAGYLDTYGWILAQTDQLGEASGTLLRAIEIDDENIDAMVHLGLVHEMRGETEKAIKRLQQAREIIDRQQQKAPAMKKRFDEYRSKIDKTLARLS